MTDSLSRRELAALNKCAEGFIEPLSNFPRGVGRETVASLVERGLLAPAHCETYGTEGFAITPEGEVLLGLHRR